MVTKYHSFQILKKQSAVSTQKWPVRKLSFFWWNSNIQIPYYFFTGMQEYCVDFRMCGAATSHQNWQLYSYPLKMLKPKQKMCKKCFTRLAGYQLFVVAHFQIIYLPNDYDIYMKKIFLALFFFFYLFSNWFVLIVQIVQVIDVKSCLALIIL